MGGGRESPGIDLARFFPKGVVHSIKPYGSIAGASGSGNSQDRVTSFEASDIVDGRQRSGGIYGGRARNGSLHGGLRNKGNRRRFGSGDSIQGKLHLIQEE
ncbi:hypothetical protein HHK36_011087 [Tetracentron sinense]|uniref:Uncharacterized protein n=1 Tax=Tetracentron sinense TaxID=13715 RepID=A0A835DFW4_TETSI|nr:hypothetical protein HHK36_011087 [Tetracentron sinense]